MVNYDEDYPPVVRSVRRFLRTIGLLSPLSGADKRNELKKLTSAAKMPEGESKRFAEQLYNGPDFVEATHADTTAFVNNIIANSVNIVRDLKSIYQLNPELLQVDRILVSSIISPNDLQTDALSIIVDNELLSQSSKTKLSKLLTDHFNTNLDLSTKLPQWISNALVKYGSQPVLILPPSNVRALYQIDKAETNIKINPTRNRAAISPTTESFDIFIPTVETIVQQPNHKATKLVSIEPDFMITCEAAVNDKLSDSIKAICKSINKNSTALSYTEEAALHEITKGAIAQIEELSKQNNSIKISTDISEIKNKKAQYGSVLKDELDRLIDDYFITTDTGKNIFSVNDTVERTAPTDSPSFIELPAESVAPVHIPGSPKDHIGYFILLDMNGSPITTSSCTNLMSQRSLTDLSKEATYGVPTVIYRSSGYGLSQRYDATSAVFSTTIKRMMEKKLGQFGLSGAEIEHSSSFINCLFYNFMQKRETELIFIPSSLMTYYAYSYRDDGTGKSILEDVFFIYALRSSLLTAKTMSAIRNATDKTKISFDAKDDVNVLQTIDDLTELYVSKQTTNISVDPASILHDITNKSVYIEPANIMGLDNFKVSVEQTAENHASPDDALIDKLGDLGLSGIGVPPAALNQLAEQEYAASVATTNLFFANQNRCYQKITNILTTKLVRQYLRYDQVLQNQIYDILLECNEKVLMKDTSTDQAQIVGAESSENEVPKDTNPEIDKELALRLILSSVTTQLPPTIIAANRSHMKEISEFKQSVQDILDGLYPDDLVAGPAGNDLRPILSAMRAKAKQKLTREFIETIGFQGATDIPHLEDIDSAELEKIVQLLAVISKGLDAQSQALNLTQQS